MRDREISGQGFCGRFLRDRSGGTFVAFSLTITGLLGASGAAIDYIHLTNRQAQLQTIADASALAAAREFRLGNASLQIVSQAATNHANANLQGAKITATVTSTIDTSLRAVTVKLDAPVPTLVMSMMGNKLNHAVAKATAKVVGGAPICVIGLNRNQQNTVHFAERARLQAPGCAVYADSSNKKGLVAQETAVATAAFFCSTGGADKSGGGTFNPTPQPDCPVIPDPLSARPAPPVGACMENKTKKIESGSAILNPGVYCGGIKISNNAQVNFQPGIYVIKDGDLKIEGTATVTGNNVGFYFTGNNSTVNFEGASTVSFTAPKVGALAGILFFEDRANKAGAKHTIAADYARILLGTIYLSRGQLAIESEKAVADKSAYTIIVADRFTLAKGPTMVLNTDYYNTDIPVPDGVGPASTKAILAN